MLILSNAVLLLLLHLEVRADPDCCIANGVTAKRWLSKRVDKVGKLLLAVAKKLSQPGYFIIARLDPGRRLIVGLILQLLNESLTILQLLLQY